MTDDSNSPLGSRVSRTEAALRDALDLRDRRTESLGTEFLSFSSRLFLKSIDEHVADLRQQLRQQKETLNRELIDLRLFSGRMHGSVPIDLAARVLGSLGKAVTHAAKHISQAFDTA